VRLLGIETSCDETAAAIVEDGVVVHSSVVASQNEIHEEFAGVVPELASRAHVERITPVIRSAIAEAHCTYDDIDAIAVGHRPGLIGSLLVGVSAAKALAWSLGKPLIAVDHVQAHLYAGLLQTPDAATQAPLTFPALGFVVSGGHTSLYLLRDWGTLVRLGGTIDDAMGEAYDKAASILGVPFPGGPNLDRLARGEGANDRAVELPVSRLEKDSLDFSFSGLKTAVLYAAKGVPPSPNPRSEKPPPPLPLTDARVADIAASFQRAASRAAIIKIERALDMASEGRLKGLNARTNIKTLLVGGGVSANSRLRAELQSLAQRRSLDLKLPAISYCVDNAAMIAGLGYHLYRAGTLADLSLQATPTTAC
jgi:N6-L-threonylcarbamoyladenine synthase